ncbi:MAG TPA: glucose-6-phosphate dehydrogenase, partial [Thermoanaerobaculia bacterium]|nr:glucose-6-phosphate dehydrogenase [Thermoanaerobaculia bacterium]
MTEAAPNAATIVIFGGSGDLSKRKLVPALWELHREGRLPAGTAVLGYARTGESDETYRAEMRAAVEAFARTKPDGDAAWSAFAARLFFFRGDLRIARNFVDLDARLTALEAGQGLSGSRLYYLAVPPSAIESVVKNLGEAGMVRKADGGPWSRVIVEKPFGKDLASARALNDTVASVFRERQVFRIDHYLGKERTQNILVFRLGNGLFEPL